MSNMLHSLRIFRIISYRYANDYVLALSEVFALILAEEKYITVQSYTSQGKDEIAFEKGVIVEVLQKNLEGWWFIR